MRPHTVRDPDFAERVSASFSRQTLLALLGAELECVEPGRVDISLDYRHNILQQHAFIHGGAVATIADAAAGFAAMTLAEPGEEVLTVEFKVNFCAPAKGESLRARGRILRPGRTLVLTECSVQAIAADGTESLCAKMQQTIIKRTPQAGGPTGPEVASA